MAPEQLARLVESSPGQLARYPEDFLEDEFDDIAPVAQSASSSSGQSPPVVAQSASSSSGQSPPVVGQPASALNEVQGP